VEVADLKDATEMALLYQRLQASPIHQMIAEKQV